MDVFSGILIHTFGLQEKDWAEIVGLGDIGSHMMRVGEIIQRQYVWEGWYGNFGGNEPERPKVSDSSFSSWTSQEEECNICCISCTIQPICIIYVLNRDKIFVHLYNSVFVMSPL